MVIASQGEAITIITLNIFESLRRKIPKEDLSKPKLRYEGSYYYRIWR